MHLVFVRTLIYNVKYIWKKLNIHVVVVYTVAVRSVLLDEVDW